jgi:hypothetical protein
VELPLLVELPPVVELSSEASPVVVEPSLVDVAGRPEVSTNPVDFSSGPSLVDEFVASPPEGREPVPQAVSEKVSSR